jgi:hypothetical protein
MTADRDGAGAARCAPAALAAAACCLAAAAQEPPAPAAPAPAWLPIYAHDGEGHGAALGECVAIVGDVDRDGCADYAMGAPRDATVRSTRGSVWVHSGKDGRVLYVFRGATAGEAFGFSVAGGDVDGDGAADLVIGAPYADDKDGRTHVGSVHVFSGKDGRLLRMFWGRGEGDSFGAAVCTLGDVDGDGGDDVAVGTPYADLGQSLDLGAVQVFNVKTRKLLLEARGRTSGDRFGCSIARASDLDGDGRPELLIGAEGAGPEGRRAGGAFVYGSKGGEQLLALRGTAGEYFGAAVAGGLDVDGDGVGDLAVGAWNAATGEGMRGGAVYLFSGVKGAPLGTLHGEDHLDRFGRALGVGDVDGDGVADLFAGAPRESGRGYVRAFSGRNLARFEQWRASGSDGLFGFAIAVGDLDGDGRAEVVVGVPRHVRGDDMIGRVEVLSRSLPKGK